MSTPTNTEAALAVAIREHICGNCPRRSRFQKLRINTPRACERDCCVYEHISEFASFVADGDPTIVSFDGAVQSIILHERNRQNAYGESRSVASLIEYRTKIAQLMRETAKKQNAVTG